jgi:Protein of unknown function (DUF2569)
MNEIAPPPVFTETVSAQQPPPIGGWLIVIAIGLVISLLQNLTGLFQSLAPLRGPVWERLTDPSSPRYNAYWRGALIFEVVAACLYLLMNLIAVILFFGKRRLFPILTVVFIPSIFILGLVDHYLGSLIPAVAASQEHAKGVHWLAVKFVALHVWIPYLLVSKRVKATFVR